MFDETGKGVDSLQQLLDFLQRLEAQKIHFTLEHNRDEALMVLIAVPGEHWEVEFFTGGGVEVEIFRSDGRVLGDLDAQAALNRLFAVHGDDTVL